MLDNNEGECSNQYNYSMIRMLLLVSQNIISTITVLCLYIDVLFLPTLSPLSSSVHHLGSVLCSPALFVPHLSLSLLLLLPPAVILLRTIADYFFDTVATTTTSFSLLLLSLLVTSSPFRTTTPTTRHSFVFGLVGCSTSSCPGGG